LAGLFLLYAAQGAPEGLLYVAVPAWLAVNGASAEAIGGYIAIILLPWGFKLINGMLMDRITYLPMGRRRPWLICAQAALVLTLLMFGARAPDAYDLAYMTAVGFLVNLAGAFQDVAIDGMAIDVVPEHERAQANGVMWGGKILGTAAAAVVTGIVITRSGFADAALVTALFVGAVMLVPLLVRERPGERLVPWSGGMASAQSVARQLTGWVPMARALGGAMGTPANLLLAAGIFIAFSGYGVETALGPVLAVKQLGFTEETYGELTGAANLVGGLFGIFLCGMLADWLGPRCALILSLIGMGVLQVVMAGVSEIWAAPHIFAGYTVIYLIFFVLMSVSLYAEAMRVSTPAVAATQFSIFMAILNLGTSFGAQRFGAIRQDQGFEGAFAVAGAAALLAAVILSFARSGFWRK
jgi:PAT family beta-lactamase induction signal transducer AmpG